jgi:uncharacterized protein (DUF1697 family)
VPVFVALLRAINLGKQRRVGMADLRAALEDAGYDRVATHLQSGNVLLAHGSRKPGAVATSVEKILQADFGLEVDVMVRTAAEITKITRSNPWAGSRSNAAAVHVAFLKSKPPVSAARAVSGDDFGRDEFVLRGTEIYLRYASGMTQGSKMSGGYFERALGTRATTRTWKVVTKLQELATATPPS